MKKFVVFFLGLMISVNCFADSFSDNMESDNNKWGTRTTKSYVTEASNRFMRLTMPFSYLDTNHKHGIGNINLLLWYPTGQYNTADFDYYNNFQGATVSFKIRGNSFNANGTKLYFWVQSQVNPEVGTGEGWRCTNWCYTDEELTSYLTDGNWHEVEITLVNDESKWTQAGANFTDGTDEGYNYWPLELALWSGNVNFHFVFVSPKWYTTNAPSGSVDIDDFSITWGE